jgi:hypothetical protein
MMYDWVLTGIVAVCLGVLGVWLFVLIVSWSSSREKGVKVSLAWVRWRNALVVVVASLTLIVVAAGLFVAINVMLDNPPPVEESVSVSEAELAKGKVVDVEVPPANIPPCRMKEEGPTTNLCVYSKLQSDSLGWGVRVGIPYSDETVLHLGESKKINRLGTVTLLAFENQGGGQYVRLLVVPDESSTWMVVKSANIPQSELDKGMVVDVRVGENDFPGSRVEHIRAVMGDDIGTLESGVFVLYGSFGKQRVSLRLGESKQVDGLGTVTLVAFEDLDWDQGFRLLIVPDGTGADIDADVGSGVRDDG